MNKKISIITINYNNAEGLRKTAESIVTQTRFDEVEWIIVDGGSTDGSVDVIHDYVNQIDWWVSEKDSGIYNAMNKGIRQAHGEYLLFRNSGDLMSNEKVIERFLSHPAYGKTDYCCGIHECMSDGKWVRSAHPVKVVGVNSYDLAHPSTFIRRERFKNEYYDESYRIAADSKFFLMDLIMRNASYAALDFAVCKFDSSGISATNIEESRSEYRRLEAELIPPRILSLIDTCPHANNNPKSTKLLFKFITNRTWEFKVLKFLAIPLYIPRYTLKKLRKLYQRILDKPLAH